MFVATCRGCNQSFDGQIRWHAHEEVCPYLRCGPERWHGTNTGYVYHGCRDPQCRAAHRIDNQRRYHATKT